MRLKRVFLIVLDSVGIGSMPDAELYHDAGSDTLGHILAARLAAGRPLRLPHLQRLGLGNIRAFPGLPAAAAPLASYGRCVLASEGKDTTTGHWEMAGILLHPGFPTYPDGFPAELVAEFERRIGRPTLGNVAASGTEIIQRLGARHCETGWPILYTSADSVFQLAAHEQVVPLEELYRFCAIARELLAPPHRVGRVIARPFLGDAVQGFTRTRNRHDYAVPPPEGMLLDRLAAADVPVLAVGKIRDIFLGRGITAHRPMRNNAEGMRHTVDAARTWPAGLVFTNLVDFDMLYGHRNDVEGYAQALEEFDEQLGTLLPLLEPEDLLLITADHGCDPTTPSTDHSREYVPLLAWTPPPGASESRAPAESQGRALGTRATLADVGATIGEGFGVGLGAGASFLAELGIEAATPAAVPPNVAAPRQTLPAD